MKIQTRGMIYGVQEGVGSEACILFCLLRSEPREVGEMQVSSFMRAQ